MKNINQTLGGLFLLSLGSLLLTFGYSDLALAYNDHSAQIIIDHERIDAVIDAILSFLEGSFGALIMVISGIGAIISSAFGQYRAALGLLVVAIGCFILRSLVNTFFARPDFSY